MITRELCDKVKVAVVRDQKRDRECNKGEEKGDQHKISQKAGMYTKFFKACFKL